MRSCPRQCPVVGAHDGLWTTAGARLGRAGGGGLASRRAARPCPCSRETRTVRDCAQTRSTNMGWFSTSKPDVSAVSREDRKQCWEGRDAYFTCLDHAGVLEAGKEGNACTQEKSHYEATCAKSWASLLSLFRRPTFSLAPPFFASRSSTSTSVGSWLNSRKTSWLSQRCRLRRSNKNDIDSTFTLLSATAQRSRFAHLGCSPLMC